MLPAGNWQPVQSYVPGCIRKQPGMLTRGSRWTRKPHRPHTVTEHLGKSTRRNR